MRATRKPFSATSALVLLFTASVVWATEVPAARAAPASTVVTLTFDDGDADQFAAARTMAEHDLAGTFYITTSWVGADGYLTREQVDTIAGAGHEIGGHTVTHSDLSAVPLPEAAAEICTGRAVLDSWGHRPTSFSYPFMQAGPEVERLTADCGYDTARGLGDIASPFGCLGCPVAETLPPANAQYLRAPAQIDAEWTLEHMKAAVTDAVRSGGGWVLLTFHRVCAPFGAACPADRATTPELFAAFTAWLDAFRDDPANGTAVQTVGQTVRGYAGVDHPAYRPARTAEPRPPAPEAVNALLNPSLEDVDPATGLPTCWQSGGWGENTPRWRTVSPGRTGDVAQHLEMTGYTDGDAKLFSTMDLRTCAPTARPGATYEVGAWYRSTGRSQIALYYRTSSYDWVPWVSSPWFAPEPTTWTKARFVTPPLPEDATGLSFGLALAGNGTLTTDDYLLAETDDRPVAAPADDHSGAFPWPGSMGLWVFAAVLVLQALLLLRRAAGRRNQLAP